MPKQVINHTKLLKHFDMVADQYKDLIIKIEAAAEAGDEGKAKALLDEILQFRPTFLRMLDQAKAYITVMKNKEKRSQEQQKLKHPIN